MTVYQIHEYSGDYMDRIVGTYFLRQRAEEEKHKLKIKEKELVERCDKCMRCPFLDCNHADLDVAMSIHSGYCDYADIFYDDEFGLDCKNFLFMYPERVVFEIEEVEVME